MLVGNIRRLIMFFFFLIKKIVLVQQLIAQHIAHHQHHIVLKYTLSNLICSSMIIITNCSQNEGESFAPVFDLRFGRVTEFWHRLNDANQASISSVNKQHFSKPKSYCLIFTCSTCTLYYIWCVWIFWNAN